jgi:hypothetical protein
VAPKILSVVNLVERSKLYGAALVGTSVHQSLPIPAQDEGRSRVGFLYARAEVAEPGEGLKIWPPHYAAFINPADGQLERVRAVCPEDFGRNDDPEAPIGKYMVPAELAKEEVMTGFAKFYQAFDTLLPEFLAGTAHADEDLKRHANAFRYAFRSIREEPLRDYYASLGKTYFAWLDRIAGPEEEGE